MKNFIYLMWLLLFITINCVDNNDLTNSDLNLENNSRLSFKNFDKFNEKTNELFTLDKDDLEVWINKNNPNSLYSKIQNGEEPTNELPEAYNAILNKNREFIIDNKIIWFNDGKLYEFDLHENKSKITSLKNNVHELSPIGSISDIVIEEKTNQNNNSSRIILNEGGGVDSRFQHEFRVNIRNFYGCKPSHNIYVYGIFKYVYELHTITTQIHGWAYSKLYFIVKLEYYTGHRWRTASEPRSISLNLNYSATLKYNHSLEVTPSLPGGKVIAPYFTKNFVCSNNQKILLANYDKYKHSPNVPWWDIKLSGNVTQSFNGNGEFLYTGNKYRYTTNLNW